MSPSSSGSWSGARADILDLDRYMRAGVRPSRKRNTHYERLVVDGGDMQHKTVDATGGKGARDKRYSQDSGMSDDSYVTRRDRDRAHKHRRATASIQDDPDRSPRELTSTRTVNRRGASSDSLRAFRLVCEQALIDQQKQIARVAQLCEQLTDRTHNQNISVETDVQPADHLKRPEIESEHLNNDIPESVSERREQIKKLLKNRSERSAKDNKVPSETSDISSSSRSTMDPRRKEKHRTQEFKTYKIIMSKLDELNRRFPTRSGPRAPTPAPPRARSASSVSVCDKLVATDPERNVDKIIRPTVQMVHTLEAHNHPWGASAAPWGAPAASWASASVRRPRVLAHACSVDIAPRDVLNTPNVVTENVIKRELSCGSRSSAGDPRCGFDLEDPVHLYSQAKRLQTLSAITRRTRSVDARAASPATDSVSAREHVRESTLNAHARRDRDARSPSLCSMCRGYWRSLRQCLVGPFAQDCKCP